ncbi:MAG TPA: Lrp/AsnC family transcriptional regulator [Gemmatimonadaceae bacterium]|nr:Lrp/AsnC family transcriptional regulator [Gemmatimonadaceae bacterium]
MQLADIDRTDAAILAALQKDGRLSNKDLAERVGLAASSCHERVRKLTDGGAIRGFHADIDPAALGYTLEAMIAVRLQRHSRDQYDAFRAAVLALDEVKAVHHLAGENDFLVHVMARDTAHLRDLALDHFIARPEVGHIETWLIFEHVRG